MLQLVFIKKYGVSKLLEGIKPAYQFLPCSVPVGLIHTQISRSEKLCSFFVFLSLPKVVQTRALNSWYCQIESKLWKSHLPAAKRSSALAHTEHTVCVKLFRGFVSSVHTLNILTFCIVHMHSHSLIKNIVQPSVCGLYKSDTITAPCAGKLWISVLGLYLKYDVQSEEDKSLLYWVKAMWNL